MPRIVPSLLAADPLRLGDAIAQAETAGADRFHLDVMDGRFVPNLTFGPATCAACRAATDAVLDVHLMVARPADWIDPFVDAGADYVTVHVEADPNLHRTLTRVRERGARAGVALNPATPLDTLEPLWPLLDLVLVMTVNPGFGGQAWIETSDARIARVRAARDAAGTDARIQVDGGVDRTTAGRAARAGAEVLVAGSALFKGDGTFEERWRALHSTATVD